MFALHVFSMLFSLGTVALADKYAFSWIIGSRETLSPGKLRIFHVLTWCGLLTLIFSGVTLALPMLSFLLTQPLFIMKVLFVGVLFVNAILIGRFSHIAASRSFASLSWNERMPLFVSGAVSSMSWSGALILALIVFK